MGIRSEEDWSGTVVDGVTLGLPKLHDDGTLEWDGGVPHGVLDANGEFTPNGLDDDGNPIAKVKFEERARVKFRAVRTDEDGNVLEDTLEGQVREAGDKLFVAVRATSSLPPGKDWRPVRDKSTRPKPDRARGV